MADSARNIESAAAFQSVDDTLPSPPYRQRPLSVHSAVQSPPYRSSSQVHLMDEKEDHTPTDDTPEVDRADKAHAPKPSVHYTDGFVNGPSPVRLDSSEGYASKAPSLAPSYEDYDDEDYDWSSDDDLVDEEAKKFEQQVGGKKERSTFMKIVTFFLSTLVGSTITAGIIVAAAVLVHVFYYNRSNDSNRSHRKYVTQNVEAWLFWAAANLLISWFLAFLINIVPAIATWTIFIVWGHISESMKNRVELYNSVKDTIKPVFYAASCWLSWVILFAHIFKLYNQDDTSASLASYTPRVYEAVEFVFFLVLVLCLQSLLSQMIAFAFHRVAFKDRLESLFLSLKTIERLKNYKPRHHRSSRLFGGFSTPISKAAFTFGSGGTTPHNEKSRFTPNASRAGTPDPDGDGNAGDTEDNVPSSRKGKERQKHTRVKTMDGALSPTSRPSSPANAGRHATEPSNGHTYPPKQSPTEGISSLRFETHARRSSDSDDENVVLHAAKALKSAVLHDARNITGNGDDDTMNLGWSVGSPQEAKRLARSIYQAFRADRRRSYLVAEDFYPAYATHEEAEEAYRVFDTDGNGDISRAEIKAAVTKAYRERRFLSRSMRDVSTALRSLNQVLLFFAFVVLFFISLSVFHVNITESLSSVYTLGIAASFIFKTSASNMFDAIMFLFVTHPFDTGDRCFIDAENLVVKKMGLFATVFARSDGSETYYFNSQLFSKFITNARRSGKTSESCTLQIAWRTPLEKIDELEKRLNEWLSTEENRWFQPSTSITLQKIENQRYLEITIGIPHNGNWQDWGLRNTRKTAFYAAANYYCRQLGIKCANSPMPIVYTNADSASTQQFSPPMSPASPEAEESDEPAPASTEDLKPMLGFLPPPDKRSSTLLRARKSKGRKGAFRAMDGS
ncbi:hypothetical protein M0805_005417 [Coniferiporia weirii]|nr:hypothetical protein M0805_005417 [Coniferiporia weirii]